jgi:hypothetical protein
MAAEFNFSNVSAGMSVGSGVASAISAWGTASSNKIVNRANAQAAETIRKAQNQQRASGLSLAATMRGMTYRAALGNAGQSVNDAGELIARQTEAFIRNDMEVSVKGAEQRGAMAARAAAAGVGGASIRVASYTLDLQQARLTERQQERNSEVMYELVKQRAGIMPAAVSRLDVNPLNPNFDYSVSQEQGGNSANLLMYLAQGVLSQRENLQVGLNAIAGNDFYKVRTDLPATEAVHDLNDIFIT